MEKECAVRVSSFFLCGLRREIGEHDFCQRVWHVTHGDDSVPHVVWINQKTRLKSVQLLLSIKRLEFHRISGVVFEGKLESGGHREASEVNLSWEEIVPTCKGL